MLTTVLMAVSLVAFAAYDILIIAKRLKRKAIPIASNDNNNSL